VIIHQTIQKLKLEQTCILTKCDDLYSFSTYFCEERTGQIRFAAMNWVHRLFYWPTNCSMLSQHGSNLRVPYKVCNSCSVWEILTFRRNFCVLVLDIYCSYGKNFLILELLSSWNFFIFLANEPFKYHELDSARSSVLTIFRKVSFQFFIVFVCKSAVLETCHYTFGSGGK
jgi:hypothetical protein